MVSVITWWLILQILGWLAFPVAFRILRWLPDRGYTFSKPLGLLLASYCLWFGASTGFLRNTAGGALAAVLILAGLGAAFYWRERGALNDFLHRRGGLILTTELLFTLAFLCWAVLRAYAPYKIMSAGGEKWMEIAFLNGILNSSTFPPLDPWLSGFSISYYYFGYVMMALVTRLSGAAAGVGFELYDALLFALTGTGAFGVVYNLATARLEVGGEKHGSRDRQGVGAGLLGALFVAGLGNLEGFFEALHSRGLLPATFWQWLDVPGLAEAPVTGAWYPGGYMWGAWWRASRVIQDYDLVKHPSGVSPITEFPFFSFLLGDNHPHVLALPFALLCVGLAFNLMLSNGKRQTADSRDQIEGQDHVFATSHFSFAFFPGIHGDIPLFLIYALCLGAMGFLNTWDMPVYIGLVSLAALVGGLQARRRLDWGLVWDTILLAIALLVAAVLLYIFFYAGFSSQAGGIIPYIFPPTRLPQYLLIFGPFVFILAVYLVVQARGRLRLGTFLRTWGGIAAGILGVFILALGVIALSGAGQSALADPGVQAALGETGAGGVLLAILRARLLNPWLFLLLTLLIGLAAANALREVDDFSLPAEDAAPDSDRFVFILAFTGLALTLVTEFFFLRDIFGARMNTVFKFYYQAWAMLAIASAYAIWRLPRSGRLGTVSRTLFLAASGLLVAAALVYPLMAGWGRADGFRGPANLDGASEIARDDPDDWAAIEWLQQNAPAETEGVPVLLEAPGGSYNYEGRISAFTGFPAVLGWASHEQQWRGTYEQQGLRSPDIETIYTTSDGAQALELLRKWQVNYVIVGQTEQNYIQRLCRDSNQGCNLSRALRKFDAVLTPVFQQGDTLIYRVPK